MKFKVSKEAKFNIKVGVVITFAVLLFLFIYNQPSEYAPVPKGRNKDADSDISDSYSDYTVKRPGRPFPQASKPLGEDMNSVKTNDDITVPPKRKNHRDWEDIQGRVNDGIHGRFSDSSGNSFMRLLRELQSEFENCIFSIPSVKLDILMLTSDQEAETFLLEEFSPTLLTFYEDCKKLSQVLFILSSTREKDVSDRPLLLWALSKGPPEAERLQIEQILASLRSPYEELFMHVRKNPSVTFEELPLSLAMMLMEAATFETLECPRDVEAPLLVLYTCAQSKRPRRNRR